MIISKCKRIVFIALLCLVNAKSFSQLVLQNNLTVPIEVCIGWYEKDGNWAGCETKGWYVLDPGQSVEPGYYFYTKNSGFCFYARTTSGPFKEVISGVKLLVHPKEGFDIKNADMDYIKTQNPVYEWKYFKIKKVVFKKWWQDKRYVFAMTMSDITDSL